MPLADPRIVQAVHGIVGLLETCEYLTRGRVPKMSVIRIGSGTFFARP